MREVWASCKTLQKRRNGSRKPQRRGTRVQSNLRVPSKNALLHKTKQPMAPNSRDSNNPKHASNPAAAQTQAKFQQALALHQNGQLGQAQTLYEEILNTEPDHSDALHLSGVIAFQTNNYQTALSLMDRAIKIRPDATFYYNRGNVLHGLTQLDAAVASYNKAIRL